MGIGLNPWVVELMFWVHQLDCELCSRLMISTPRDRSGAGVCVVGTVLKVFANYLG